MTEAQPLIDYIQSGVDASALTSQRLGELRAMVETAIKNKGALRIDSITGLFIAERD